MDFEKVLLLVGRAIRKVFVKPGDAALSARMALWVVLVSLLARVTSLPRVQQIAAVRRRPAATADRADTAAHLARTLDRLLRLDRFLFRRSCWKRALVLHRFLALRGIESRINFGMRKRADGTLQGHAWLEHQGRPLLEDDADAYVVTFSLPRDTPHGTEGAAVRPPVEAWDRPWP